MIRMVKGTRIHNQADVLKGFVNFQQTAASLVFRSDFDATRDADD